jgi:hypothetical protein
MSLSETYTAGEPNRFPAVFPGYPHKLRNERFDNSEATQISAHDFQTILAQRFDSDFTNR